MNLSGEAVWFPSVLVTDPRVRWEAIMDHVQDLIRLVQELAREAERASRSCGRREFDALQATAEQYVRLDRDSKARGEIERPHSRILRYLLGIAILKNGVRCTRARTSTGRPAQAEAGDLSGLCHPGGRDRATDLLRRPVRQARVVAPPPRPGLRGVGGGKGPVCQG